MIDLDALERVLPALRSWAAVTSPMVKTSVGADLLRGILAGALPQAIAELRAARKVVEALKRIQQADIDRDYGAVGMGYLIADNAMEEYEEALK